jgi:5-formyltetrahydrofolate cyclo-ligase
LQRIGTGYGYYDRWFQQTNFQSFKVGLAREINFSDEKIQADSFDVPLDFVVTEKEIYALPKNEKLSFKTLNDWRDS